ncbi:pilus assembly protein [Nocardioides agariphilus]|uniref:Pilus assembly protein n=1 Tax=Nocardioides agariphilus TaxID=433664 RepID=A0A930YP86_9ACTN|nr:pilus assembly protein [Nocardioides agariphilus]
MSTFLSRSRPRRTESGASALEFGLIVGTILIPLLLGVVQYGWYFYVAQTTGGAATHVARRLSVGDCWGSNEALNFAKAEVASKPSQTTLSKSPTSNSTAVIGTTQLTVTVTANGDLIGFLPMPNGGTITRTVKTMIEDTTSSGTC